MRFLDQMLPPGSVGAGLATLCLAVTFGLAIGSVKIRGLKLGLSGVLFSALIFGQFGLTVDNQVLSFIRDFSLIVFVYTIGLQVGPGFVDSLKAEGLRLNMLAIAVLILGMFMTAVIFAAFHLNSNGASGLYAGAFTTTPGLAAGQEVLLHSAGTRAADAIRYAGLAYAVTYPFGMIGPVLAIAFLRKWFNVNVTEELKAHEAATHADHAPMTFVDIRITNPAIAGRAIKEFAYVRQHNILFTRFWHDGKLSVPTADTRPEVDDILRAVGPQNLLDELVLNMGKLSQLDLATVSTEIGRMDLVVTNTAILRKPLRQLNLINRYGVAVSRITRVGVDLLPTATTALHFNDLITVVGPKCGLKAVEVEVGNSPDVLNRPQLAPIFLGIVLGVIVGSIPIALPGVSGGIKLGLAAGPMLVAIALSRMGNIGAVVWYMPASANQLLRDFGLALFLACVGLQQGDGFVQKLLTAGGLTLVAWGVFITMVPVIIVGIIARKTFKMNFITLAGWVAGAMTSSPALLYANELTQSDASALAYAAVAPLAMIVPILCCQFLAALLH